MAPISQESVAPRPGLVYHRAGSRRRGRDPGEGPRRTPPSPGAQANITADRSGRCSGASGRLVEEVREELVDGVERQSDDEGEREDQRNQHRQMTSPNTAADFQVMERLDALSHLGVKTSVLLPACTRTEPSLEDCNPDRAVTPQLPIGIHSMSRATFSVIEMSSSDWPSTRKRSVSAREPRSRDGRRAPVPQGCRRTRRDRSSRWSVVSRPLDPGLQEHVPPPCRRCERVIPIPMSARCSSERSIPPARWRCPTSSPLSNSPQARRHPRCSMSVDHRVTSGRDPLPYRTARTRCRHASARHRRRPSPHLPPARDVDSHPHRQWREAGRSCS